MTWKCVQENFHNVGLGLSRFHWRITVAVPSTYYHVDNDILY